MKWLYVAGLAGGAIALAALYRASDRPRPAAPPDPA